MLNCSRILLFGMCNTLSFLLGLMFDYICVVILSVIIFKEVDLVNRRVWVDKDLASQRSLLRKLLKEARGSFLRKPLNETS